MRLSHAPHRPEGPEARPQTGEAIEKDRTSADSINTTSTDSDFFAEHFPRVRNILMTQHSLVLINVRCTAVLHSQGTQSFRFGAIRQIQFLVDSGQSTPRDIKFLQATNAVTIELQAS